MFDCTAHMCSGTRNRAAHCLLQTALGQDCAVRCLLSCCWDWQWLQACGCSGYTEVAAGWLLDCSHVPDPLTRPIPAAVMPGTKVQEHGGSDKAMVRRWLGLGGVQGAQAFNVQFALSPHPRLMPHHPPCLPI